MWSPEESWDALRADVRADLHNAQALADGSADHLKARFHRGQVAFATRVLDRMDELDRNGPVEPL
jgi:hypothetical protein